MATSRKEIENPEEDEQEDLKQRSNNSAHFAEGAVASEDDLDGILRDVEKIKAKARCCKNSDKPKWKPRIEFTQDDEKDLNQIFEDAERRKKDIEELLDAAKRGDGDDSDDDDDTSSNSSSTSSDDSSDSDLDRLLDNEKWMTKWMTEIVEEADRNERKARGV